jgi:hypothetical protein
MSRSDYELAMEGRLREVIEKARGTLPEADPRWAYVRQAVEVLDRKSGPTAPRLERMRQLIRSIERPVPAAIVGGQR